MNFLKKIFLMVTLALFATPLLAQGSFNMTDITNMNNGEPPSKNSRDYGYKTGTAKCVFDPSATTASRTVAAHTCDLKLPKNSYVTKAYYHVITTFTSATDAGTIAVSITGANDIVSAVAISTGTTWDSGHDIIIAIPTGALSNEVAVTADSYLTFTVAVEALTAGKLVFWVEYVYFGDV